ncbi:MAG: hypothetical protein Kow0059_03380 [Candidatus Sumerlaeia bacterium]
MAGVIRYFPYLGAALLAAANISGLVREAGFGPLEYVFGGIGLALLGTGLLRGGRRSALKPGWFLPAVYTLLVLGCAVWIYLIVLQHNRTIDFTSRRIHSLSDLTLKTLQGLDRPVRVVAFSENPREMEEFLSWFAAVTPRFRYEIYSPVRDVLVAQEFDTTVLPEDIFVVSEGPEGGRRQKKISAFEKLEEGALVNAIVEVTRDTSRKIYFLTGHGERALESPPSPAPNALDATISKAAALLRDRAFDVVEWNLMQKGFVPDDCAVLVEAGPAEEPSPAELDLIRNYLDDRGKLLVLLDPPRRRQSVFTGFARLLDDYGLQIPDAFVLDDNALTGDSKNRFFVPLVAMKGRHPIVQNLPTGQAALMPFARPVIVADPLPRDVQAEELLYTGKGSWLVEASQVYGRSEIPPPSPQDQRPFPIAALARKSERALRGAGSRVVVIGDSDMFTNDLINELGAVFLLNVVNWLTESEDQIAIPPKVMPETPLILSERSSRVIFAGLVVTVPTVIVLGGLGYTMHRRRMR